jgi:methionyl-tRNA formyltransferase
MTGEMTVAGRTAPLRVVVLTCEGLGIPTAAALESLTDVEVLAVMNSPHRRLPLGKKLRKVWRAGGVAAFAKSAVRRARAVTHLGRSKRGRGEKLPQCAIHEVSDLHSEECLALLRGLRPDVAVVDGTYILKPPLFDLPVFGSINLHCGKVPEYRGSPPAFWELYDGVDHVGVTVHRVSEKLDEGPVLCERAFPLDTCPAGDPVVYIESYWREVLRPHGIAMLKQAVADIRDGSARPRPQLPSSVPTHRSPTRQQVRELRRRVRSRRASANARQHTDSAETGEL